jgi:predicted DNA-binding transcriptional regulator AlpA
MVTVNGKIYLSLRQVAERTGLKPKTVWAWIDRYNLPTIRVMGLIALAEDDLVKLLAERPILSKHRKHKKVRKPKAALAE